MSNISEKLKNDPLMPLRHSAEHVLHTAMQLLYPELKKAMGPAIEDGFYFDFDLDEKVTPEDFEKIESKMNEIIAAKLPIKKIETTLEGSRKIFKDNPYKLEWLNEIEENGEKVTLYAIGEEGNEFYDLDLCAGPHVENTGEIKAFKLLNVAGAYWKGDEKNKMLQRIYATAFDSREKLDEYLNRLEEAKKRDHKKLGKELDLFFIDDDIGKGLPMWTPKGTVIKFELENFTRDLEIKYGYEHVETPYLGGAKLYERSGHLDHYQQNMYAPINMDGDLIYLRPMACPHHIKMYERKPMSYKELPIRYAEIADYNRYEKSGELMGLIRVRKFQLTDAHLFVAPEGLKEEFKNVVRLIQEGMEVLGLNLSTSYRFSKHDPNDKEKYFPDPQLWEHSEKLMKESLDELKIEYVEAEGEAAFYGPKLDVQFRNVNGKEDTAFTAQIDFLLPEKFDLEYIDEHGERKRPVMIHRSAIGCLERTFAFLIEHYAGAFPVWLSPVQAVVIPIGDKHVEYAQEVTQQMRNSKIRVEVDPRNDTMQSKIRDAQTQKIPYMLIIGDREVENGQVSVRLRSGDNIGAVKVAEVVDKISNKYLTKAQDLW